MKGISLSRTLTSRTLTTCIAALGLAAVAAASGAAARPAAMLNDAPPVRPSPVRLSMEDCVRLALRNSEEVGSADLEMDIAEGQI